MTAPEQMLKPCPNPWCESHMYEDGGPKVPDDLWGYSGSDCLRVGCHYCHMKGPGCATESEAITAWNTRPAPAELVEALRASLEAQMDAATDEYAALPSTIHREQGRVWLEGWFDLRTALRNAGAAS